MSVARANGFEEVCPRYCVHEGVEVGAQQPVNRGSWIPLQRYPLASIYLPTVEDVVWVLIATAGALELSCSGPNYALELYCRVGHFITLG
jgi:hypothetical protein